MTEADKNPKIIDWYPWNPLPLDLLVLLSKQINKLTYKIYFSETFSEIFYHFSLKLPQQVKGLEIISYHDDLGLCTYETFPHYLS